MYRIEYQKCSSSKRNDYADCEVIPHVPPYKWSHKTVSKPFMAGFLHAATALMGVDDGMDVTGNTVIILPGVRCFCGEQRIYELDDPSVSIKHPTPQHTLKVVIGFETEVLMYLTPEAYKGVELAARLADFNLSSQHI
jgi:hypothetical protein